MKHKVWHVQAFNVVRFIGRRDVVESPFLKIFNRHVYVVLRDMV